MIRQLEHENIVDEINEMRIRCGDCRRENRTPNFSNGGCTVANLIKIYNFDSTYYATLIRDVSGVDGFTWNRFINLA